MGKNGENFLDSYDRYREKHIQGVKEVYEWMKENIAQELIEAEYVTDVVYPRLETLINTHDVSKIMPEEYLAYAEYYFGKRDTRVKERYEKAWLHHMHNNPHHWEYWVRLDEDSEKWKTVEMPDVYVIEMICDWASFGWNEGKREELFDWWEKKKEILIMGDKTRGRVERVLREMKKKGY